MSDFPSLIYIRKYYLVPAYLGVRVRVAGQLATIVGGHDAYIRVRLDGQRDTKLYHPTDDVTYYIEPNRQQTLTDAIRGELRGGQACGQR